MSIPGIIVQARMGGERFPGKVLAPFLGEPMLRWQLKRLQQVRLPDHALIVACPATPENRLIKLWCDAWKITCRCYDVPEQDVLARYVHAADECDIDPIIRVTGDCPLLDPVVIENLWAGWLRTPHMDHFGIGGVWADGQDCEIISRAALQKASMNATALSDREHVTAFIWSHPEVFYCATLPCPRDCSWQQYSVDTPADLVLAQALAKKAFERNGSYWGWADLGDLLREDETVRAMHDQRPARNHRYTQQVAQEQGWEQPMDWHSLRYGTEGTG